MKCNEKTSKLTACPVRNEVKEEIYRCPYCQTGPFGIATGPVWKARSEEDGQSETLVEYICENCDKSFWL